MIDLSAYNVAVDRERSDLMIVVVRHLAHVPNSVANDLLDVLRGLNGLQ